LLREDSAVDFISQLDSLTLAGAALAICFLLFVLTLIIYIRQRKLLARYRRLLNGESAQDLESLLLEQEQMIKSLEAQVADLKRLTNSYSREAKKHVQKVGMVRFNAFPDTGSDLSFAIALLDGEDNGVVLSSLYGRAESRIYAKPIQGGTSTYKLSDEEKEAIQKARSGNLASVGEAKAR